MKEQLQLTSTVYDLFTMKYKMIRCLLFMVVVVMVGYVKNENKSGKILITSQWFGKSGKKHKRKI